MPGNPYTSRKKMRFTDFDYRTQGCYFITIVSHKRKCLFGHVENEEMLLNEAGLMIEQQYMTIGQRFTSVECLDYVVMPNHFHCILCLDNEVKQDIPKIMDYFKSITTNEYIRGVKERGWQRFEQHIWQRNYWDDIIWNNRQFEYVKNYIATNPIRWNKDNINPNHDDDVDHILKHLKQLG